MRRNQWLGGGSCRSARSAGFTLIELLVVVAIIALLISILLPSLSRAREQSKTAKCAANLRSVGQAVATYLAEEKFTYPASYQYLDKFGNIVFTPEPQDGYAHWSYSLFSRGQVNDAAFQCPTVERGGHPRTFPGPRGEDWNSGEQIDGGGQLSPNDLVDRQAPRVAYTANAAIMPRNKWTTTMVPGAQRTNQYARESDIARPAEVIVAADFTRSFSGVGEQQGNTILSKSHRPVNPFYHAGSGYDEYGASKGVGFQYTATGDKTYGLAPFDTFDKTANLIGGSQGTELNAIGRHHPGEDKLGGSANFLYGDGHVERDTVLRTMEFRRWGDKYYALTGNNEIVDRYGNLP